MHQNNVGLSKLTITSPSTSGISAENKPTVPSLMSPACPKGPRDFFPKIGESSNLNDKLGVPINTLTLSKKTLRKCWEQEASTSYKDALLTVGVAPSDVDKDVLPVIVAAPANASLLSSAEMDLLNSLLAKLQAGDSPQECPKADLDTTDQASSTPEIVHPECKLQRSQ